MKTSRKRRILLRTAATSIPCHLSKPWLCRLRALPRPQAPEPFSGSHKNKQTVEHKPRCFRNQKKQEPNRAATGEVFLNVRVWEAAPPGLSSLEASSIFSRKPAESSWHCEELDKVSSERGPHTHYNLQHKGQTEPAQTLLALFRAGPPVQPQHREWIQLS